MSTSEYFDLYEKAQTNGKYNMFCFDIVDSKKMSSQSRQVAQNEMIKLMLKMYSDIKEIELKTNKKILVTNDGIVQYGYTSLNKIGMLVEPFILGDMFGFTVYRDSIEKELILELYKKNKEELKIDFDFHIKDGYYETNKYEEGNILFFRGYCIDILSNYHKEYFNVKK